MAQYGAPNFLDAIVGGYEAGSRAGERSRLAELDEQGRRLTGAALGGDQSALKQLGGVNPEAYMKIKTFTTQEKRQRLDELAAGAYAANTPEKWAAFVQQSAAQGHALAPGETRDSILAQAMTLKDQLDQANSDRSFNQQKLTSDRAYNLDVQQFNESKRVHNAEIAAKGAAGPDLVEIFDEKTGQPYKARWNPTTRQYDRVGGVKAGGNELTVTLADGTIVSQGPGKPLTESQSKDTAYLTRMTEAVPLVDQMGEKLTSFGENVGAGVPLVGNYLKSPEYQQAEQAAGQWRQAFLRKDSGATITKDETADTNALYIPQPGDKAPVLRQKAQARRTATLAVKLGLPPKAVMEMQKAGIDVDKILGAPLPGQGGKSDQSPRIRTYNKDTGELE